MTNESLKKLLKIADYLEKSSAPDIADEMRKCVSNIKSDLEVSDVFKNNLKIEFINDNPLYDGSYLIYLENDENHYICISITEEEKELLKEWLKNDRTNNKFK